MNAAPLESYPLRWPLGRPRTPAPKRASARFGTKVKGEHYTSARQLTIDGATNRLRDTIGLLRATGFVISTNLQLRKDGLPRSGQSEPSDPGVAVYFSIFKSLKSHNYVVACDKWDRVADNIAACAAHLEAVRGQDRWGCGSLEQAFAGYKALTAAEAIKSWWTVLGFTEPPKSWFTVADKHTELVRRHHPDRGGDQSTMASINAARDEAKTFYAEFAL